MAGKHLSGWKPLRFDIAAMKAKGATVVDNSGCGWSWKFAGAANDEILLQATLDYDGFGYDGVDLLIALQWGLTTPPAPGDTVIWEIDHAVVRAGDDPDGLVDATNQDSIDISGRSAAALYEDQLTVLAGKGEGKVLNMTLRRRSSGAGSDTHAGDVFLYGIKILRAA